MGFWESEKSLAAGQPYELHEFCSGSGDGETFWCYADAPHDIEYDGHIFTALYISGGPIEHGATAIKNRTIVKCDWTNPFAWQYRICAPNDIVHYVRYKGHGEDVVPIFRGDVVDVIFRQKDRTGERWAEIIIDPGTAAMARQGLVVRYGRQCGVELYSAACTMLRRDWEEPGELEGVSGNILTSSTFGEQAAGYWLGGDIIVGNHRRKIVAHDGDEITVLPIIPGLAGDEAFTAYPGCDHLAATCIVKENFDNFRGQPNIPDANPFSQWGVYR